jgi:hypothetical protein
LPARCAIALEDTSSFVEKSVNVSGEVPQSGDRPLTLERIDALTLFDTLAHRGKGVECRLYAGECRLGICMNNVQLRDIRRRDDVLPADFATFKSNIFDTDPHDGPPRPQSDSTCLRYSERFARKKAPGGGSASAAERIICRKVQPVKDMGQNTAKPDR